jgi:hypothetical protein
MSGPISDSYDPEFGTGANAQEVAAAVRDLIAKALIAGHLGSGLKPIVDVVHGADGPSFDMRFTERQLRVMRFALNRALESL